MKKYLVYFIALQFNLISGQTNSVDERWISDKSSSEIVYSGKHFLHAWSGKNNNINGLLIIDPRSNKIDKIAVLAYVKDFDSGNANRDSHSLEVLNALKFPEIIFFSEDLVNENDSIIIKGNLEFHGRKINKNIQALVKKRNKKIEFKGNFKISLSEFDIKPPSFMLAEIDDLIDISFYLEFIK